MKIKGVETSMNERPLRLLPPPLREDCWNEEATYTLIEAWGDRHMKLNRGNLRQKHWQEVAETVNAHHGTTKKSRRTDVQCKNRIDTLKKKYKSEKARIHGTLTSNWPFYYRLDSLIGTCSSSRKKNKKKKPYEEEEEEEEAEVVPISSSSTRRRRRRLVGKEEVRTIGGVDDDSFFRKRNYYAAAAATKMDSAESSRSSSERRSRKKVDDDDGFKELAQAIGKLGEIYERVEEAKQRQFIELEKQRMEFMKSLEFERMQFFMDTQIQLEKIKRSKRAAAAAAAAGNDCYLSLAMRREKA